MMFDSRTDISMTSKSSIINAQTTWACFAHRLMFQSLPSNLHKTNISNHQTQLMDRPSGDGEGLLSSLQKTNNSVYRYIIPNSKRNFYQFPPFSTVPIHSFHLLLHCNILKHERIGQLVMQVLNSFTFFEGFGVLNTIKYKVVQS